MLNFLKIRNIALIDSLEVEFGPGLNLLTGETGSGKSIIVDSLGAITGERVSSDLIKEGADSARIEAVFSIDAHYRPPIFDEFGIELDDAEEPEIIIRREISLNGKNRIFVNSQLVTAAFLKRFGRILVDIHGQGEQAALFDLNRQREMLDQFADAGGALADVADAFKKWSAVKKELESLKEDEAKKLQLTDILKFQIDEIRLAGLRQGETAELEAEKRRLNNLEKLSSLSGESYSLLYETDDSTLATLDRAARKIEELGGLEPAFNAYSEGIETARAVIEDLSIELRDYASKLEFAPGRLEEIENRLAEISRVCRKYGGSEESALCHLYESEKRLENIETAELREKELTANLLVVREDYLKAAFSLSKLRQAAAKRFQQNVVKNLADVALEKARFEVRFQTPSDTETKDQSADAFFAPAGIDQIEFYFSANVGESPRPLGKVASGGEASRLMLILKTTAGMRDAAKTAVFDEIDAGIGGRVAEAVGAKLKDLAADQQVLCVTHQPQVAAQADNHLLVEKTMGKNRTTIGLRPLDDAERIEEIARMLAGETVTEAARENARELLGLRGAEKSISRKI